MPNDKLSSVFANVLAQAASTPTQTGATANQQRRQQAATDQIVILADVSGSMSESAGAKRKVDLLQEALNQVIPTLPGATLIAFNSMPAEVAPAQPLPPPSGGTALHRALDYAAQSKPKLTLIISDGQPDDKRAALTAADKLSGRIEVIYVGPDGDFDAINFLRQLAGMSGGSVVVHDLKKQPQLASTIKQLALPGGTQ